MSHKRTKKDVEDAYWRGFEAGFSVRPNPLAIFLFSIWRKREHRKLKKEWRTFNKEWQKKLKEKHGLDFGSEREGNDDPR